MKTVLASILTAMFAVVYSLGEKLNDALFGFMGRTGLVLFATEAIKSTVITNADATPMVINTAQLANGRERSMRGVVSATTTKDAGSTYRFFRVKSNDLVKQLLLDNASWGASCTADFGLYKTAADGGAVVDADFFASAVDMNTANRALDITRESGVITVANMEKPIWELLGLSADPQIDYDVAATLVAATAATGSGCLTATVIGRN
jgi:hypothetical protein